MKPVVPGCHSIERPRSRGGVVLAFLLTGLVGVPAPAQVTMNDAFQQAIHEGQARMVKVYGATAGRVDGYASGVIVSPDGLIVSMQGVYLDGQNTRVTLADGTRWPATVLRRDRARQLALLKIEHQTPDYFELSETPVGQQGDWVVTLSNAFKVADGEEPMSVNLGIISLRTTIRARLGPRDIAYEGPLLLIDAITSNPGAGGGAVLTRDGRLAGTIGRVINSSDTNTRLNYAVPADLLQQFVENTLPPVTTENSVVGGEPGELGIRVFRLGGRRAPAYIDRIIPDSPAGQAGLRPDDLVISMAGQKIGTIREYDEASSGVLAGQEVIVVVKRGNRLVRVPLTPLPRKVP